MKQAQRVLSACAVDLFGMCSALYELGGLVVMHDASGCNSTYTTHDEPRWYDTPSMVYISALREADTIYGNDQRLVDDIAEVAEETRPHFIAIGGSPMPNAIGTDLRAVARLVEKRTGIPSFGIRTDGMHSYLPGAGEALKQFAERFVIHPEHRCAERTGSDAGSAKKLRINLLGVTPLDFSVVGNATRLKQLIAEHGMILQSCWAMGDSFEVLQQSAGADVNAVVSAVGLPAARWMKENFGIPYVTGLPMGKAGTEAWIRALQTENTSYLFEPHDWRTVTGSGAELLSLHAWKTGREPAGLDSETVSDRKNGVSAVRGCAGSPVPSGSVCGVPETERSCEKTGNHGGSSGHVQRAKGGRTDAPEEGSDENAASVLVIGEPVQLKSLQYLLRMDCGVKNIRLICPMADAPKELLEGMEVISVESALRLACQQADRIIADPIYGRLIPEAPEKLIALPHEAYSGRHYREEIPVFVGEGFTDWIRSRL